MRGNEINLAGLSIMRAIQVRGPRLWKQASWPSSSGEWIDVSPLATGQLTKQRSCLANVGNLKALRRCAAYWSEDLACVGLPVLTDPKPRETYRAPQLPEQGALVLCQPQSFGEAFFRRGG